jgi:hypothetical protein
MAFTLERSGNGIIITGSYCLYKFKAGAERIGQN